MPRSLHLGTASIDITPEGPCELTGYAARIQPSQGIHDPVWARALVFEADGRKAALLACDLLGFEPAADARIRGRLRRDLGLAGVLLTCTHTHAGPASMHLVECGTQDDAWMEALETALLETTRRAAESLAPVTAHWATAEVGIGMNRRAPIEGRARHLSVTGERPSDIPEGFYDPILTVVRFDGEKGRATILNHACHPVSLGSENRLISCDWPGVAVRLLERARDPGGYGMAVFIQGACGDINPALARRGWAECERIGMEAGEAARAALREAGRDAETTPLAFAEREITLPYRNDAGEIQVTLAALRLGEIAFVTLPGEAFCRQGADVREESPFPCTIVAAYSNGNIGYLPTRDAYPFGGYEVDDAHRYYGYPECVAPEAGELCVSTALDLLCALR